MLCVIGVLPILGPIDLNVSDTPARPTLHDVRAFEGQAAYKTRLCTSLKRGNSSRQSLSCGGDDRGLGYHCQNQTLLRDDVTF